MHTVSTNQIVDILHFNDKYEYLIGEKILRLRKPYEIQTKTIEDQG